MGHLWILEKGCFGLRRRLTGSNTSLLAGVLCHSSAATNSALLDTAGLHLGSTVAQVFLTVLHDLGTFSDLLTHLKG